MSLFYMIHQDRTLYCIYSDYQLFIIKHIFIDTYRISLTEIVCLRIVYANKYTIVFYYIQIIVIFIK